MDLNIEGSAALVTASSSGLGKASAKALAQEGVNVAINGRRRTVLEDTATELRDIAPAGTAILPVQADLTEEEDIETLVETTVDEFGGLDHLVTSAGGPPSGPFLETTDEDWYDAYDLLVMSVVRTVREATDHLQSGDGGTIVNITSRTVKQAVDQMVLSNSVRMGVIGLEKTLSTELAPEVRANAVLPGSHETSRITDLVKQGVERGDYADYQDGIDDRVTEVPLDRLGTTAEFGSTVAFLSSPRSGYINGAAMPVDGGSMGANL
ncbi:SDR family oxidoreductase [Salarchaeum sp. III]|uniref:SDR family oxidoreductase n=1 Tax=Salarchaeum sp. III TaxID=3107927 RepID=UPI002EDB3A4F